jgi:hypothetical protein
LHCFYQLGCLPCPWPAAGQAQARVSIRWKVFSDFFAFSAKVSF